MNTQDSFWTRRQIPLFFILAFALSWLVWGSQIAEQQGLLGFHIPGKLAYFGVSFAAFLVAGLAGGRAAAACHQRPVRGRRGAVGNPLGSAGGPHRLAFRATPRQLLWKVELPYALPQIMAGLTQTIMLSLSMVVIAALVGAPGLGVPVVRALNTVNIARGFEAGIVIVLVAILLDRFLRHERQGG